MAKNKLTVFQQLERALRSNWNPEQGSIPHVNSYDMRGANQVLYKTTDKEDYDRAKLELQQNKYLKDRWIKANVDLSVSAFAGLNNVKLMYRDADLMDSFPEIGAALDLVSEEASITSDRGNIVNVFSKSERIKAILEDLFVNRLNLQVTAPMIIRSMCKYGNQFMMLDIDNKLGVKGWRQLPVFNVERLENGVQNPYGAGQSISVNNPDFNDADLSTKFVWLDENNEQVPFRNWQIAHFRLLSNSMYLPYGCLAGDTRVETEYGYKEIDTIVPGDKVWTFNVDTQERELSEVTMSMPKGIKPVRRVLTKHNYIDGTLDHKILTLVDGKLDYKRIDEIQVGDLVAVSCGIKEGQNGALKIDKTPIPSSRNRGIKWFDKNIVNFQDYVDEELAEFFGFMIGDGSITYGRIISIAAGEQQSFNKKYSAMLSKYSTSKVVENKDKNGNLLSYSTSSKFLGEMLYRLGYIDGYANKRIPSWVFESPVNIKKAFIHGLMNADGYMFLDSRRPNTSIRCDIELANEQLIKDLKVLTQSLGYKSGQIFSRLRKPHYSEKIGRIMSHNTMSYELSFYEVQNTQEKCNDMEGRKTDQFKLEKVKSIQDIGETETYDITVANDNSNFFANGIVTHNCSYLNAARRHWRLLSLMEDMMFIYRLERSIERRVYKIYVGAIDDADVQAYVEQVANQFKRTPIIDPMTGQVDLRKNILSTSDDLFIPTRSENAPTPIDTLPAAQNLTAIDDIKYIQNKVLTALRIPKTFLNFEENAGDGKNLALMDIRFVRVINRIQQAFLMELTKVASIHLYLLGFDDDLTNFNLTMNNPSTQAEQLEIENKQKMISVVRDAVSDPGNGIPVMSLTRALKEIMGWSDKDIKENFEEIRLEKGIAAELEKTAQIIKRTGIFDIVDRMYGEPGAEYQDDQQMGGPDGGMGGGMPGGGGGGGFGGGLDDLGMPGGNDEGDITGQEGAEPTAEMGGAPEGGGNEPTTPEPNKNESTNKKGKLLTEGAINGVQSSERSLLEHYLSVLNKRAENENKEASGLIERADIYDKSLLINEDFSKMINSLDDAINEENGED